MVLVVMAMFSSCRDLSGRQRSGQRRSQPWSRPQGWRRI